MTHLVRSQRPTTMVHYTTAGTQTASTGDKILFSNKQTSGSDSVSITSGVISFSSSASYYLQASVSVERASSTDDFACEWYNETTNTQLTSAAGAHIARFLPTTTTFYNGCLIAQLILENPAHTVSLRAGINSFDILDNFSLLIVEIA